MSYSDFISYEINDIAITMSSSRADPMLGLNILQGWLEGLKTLNAKRGPWDRVCYGCSNSAVIICVLYKL